jgi:hypothetical protein
MAFNATALNAYVKRTYDPKFIDNSMTSVEDKQLTAIKKMTDGSGENYSFLVDGDDSFNGSASFSIAQAAAAANDNVVGVKLLSDWNDYSAVAQITESIIGKTRNSDGAWQKAVDVAMKKTLKGIAHANAVLLQSYGWGDIGQISSVSGSTFVPTIRSDITKYVKGMPLHFSASLHGNGLRSATVVYVTAVSYTVGAELVTLSATLASVSAVNTDWAFIAGCRQDSATPSRIALVGWNAWFPNQNNATDMADATIIGTGFYSASTARSSNSRLYGTFVDGTASGSALAALMDGCQEAITMGNAKRLRCFASKATWKDIAKDLQGLVEYKDNPNNKTVGTRRLTIVAEGDCEATLEVSRTMNDNQIIGFDENQIILKSIGGAPHISSDDGLTMCRQASTNGYETRWFQQALVEVPNPAGALRVQLV